MNAPVKQALMSLDDALQQLLGPLQMLPDPERVPTLLADGRVLAQSLISALHVPPQDNSSMDGYALRCADVPAAGTVLPVSQRIAAGHAAEPLLPGSCARIFTGAPIPPGADAVVMQEEVEALDGAQVRVNTAPQLGQWIRRAGEDVSRGEVVLCQGQRLDPASLGLAAGIGCADVLVARKPRVALFSTGDELVMPGDIAPDAMRPGTIYNSNRFFLKALLQRMGCEVSDMGIVPDQREATLNALRQAAQGHDVILTSGGVSVGEEDHIKPAVQALGSLDLWQIAMKPGKPFAHGHIGLNNAAGAAGADRRCHFLGLPGNPVSSFVTFVLLVRPFLLKLQGCEPAPWKPIMLPAHFDVPRADKRREFLRVRRNAQGGLDLFPNQSSGVLTSAAWADGLVDKAAGSTIAHGDLVSYLPLADWL
jgi:molybdopterin molybdotransferase